MKTKVPFSFLTILTLGLFFCPGAESRPKEKPKEKKQPPKKTHCIKWPGNHYRIVSKVEFFGILPKSPFTEKMMAYALRKVEDIWNKKGRISLEKAGGKKEWIRLEFRFRTRLRRSSEKATPGYHQIEIVSLFREYLKHKITGKSKLMDGYRSWMYVGGRHQNLAGRFGFPINITTLAHEFGHLWGVRDEYPKGKTFWKRLQERIGRLPNQEWPPSIMDYSWLPLAEPKPRHYQKIYQNIKKYRWM